MRTQCALEVRAPRRSPTLQRSVEAAYNQCNMMITNCYWK